MVKRNELLIHGMDNPYRESKKFPNGGASTYLKLYFKFEEDYWGKDALFMACFSYLEA